MLEYFINKTSEEKIMENKILHYCIKNLYEILNIPIALISEEFEIFFPVPLSNQIRSIYDKNKDIDNILLIDGSDKLWAILPINLLSQPKIIIIVGPYNISIKNISRENKSYLRSVIHLIYTIVAQKLPDVHQQWLNFDNEDMLKIEHAFKNNLNARRIEDSHLDSIEIEKRYIEAIRRNEKEKVEWLFNKVKEAYFVELSSNKIESLKYKFVSLIALVTRVSINCGVSEIEAYSLSDALIQNMENVQKMVECIKLIKEGSFAFMNLIHNAPYSKKTPLVKEMINFINIHLYEKITLSELAFYLGKHPSYISSEFKKEMGETIQQFIKRKKIIESKHLLLFTDKSYKDIALTLSFSNQSHFIKLFKSHENITPLEFRKKYLSTKIF